MKKCLMAATAAVALAASDANAAPRYSEVSVMQWNLRIGIDMTFRYNLKTQADVILKYNPDVVVLNEVDKNCARTGFVDMTHGLYGNAILSRYRMELVGSWLIPALIEETRGMTLVKIYAPNPFLVALTHLNHRTTPEANAARLQAVQKIAELIEKNNPGKLPVVLTGDFNCYPGSDPVKKLEELGWTLEKPLPSYPSGSPKSEIDHFYRQTKDRRVEVVERIAIDEKYASDHIPLVNKLKIYRKRDRK